jgi:hypothetical protein
MIEVDFPFIEDGFFDDMNRTAGYMATVKFLHEEMWWEPGIPVHRDGFHSAMQFALDNEAAYLRAFNAAAGKIRTKCNPLPKTFAALMEAIKSYVHQRHAIDGTDFSDVNPWDETTYPMFVPLAREAFKEILVLAIGASRYLI